MSITYFKINNLDLSHYVNELKVNTTVKYNAQTNARGDTVVDYINTKKTLTVGIIPLEEADMMILENAVNDFNVNVSFYNPSSGNIEENVNCIIPTKDIEFYTIQVGNVKYRAATLTFYEL